MRHICSVNIVSCSEDATQSGRADFICHAEDIAFVHFSSTFIPISPPTHPYFTHLLSWGYVEDSVGTTYEGVLR